MTTPPVLPNSKDDIECARYYARLRWPLFTAEQTETVRKLLLSLSNQVVVLTEQVELCKQALAERDDQDQQ
jgi:hypothetical protein